MAIPPRRKQKRMNTPEAPNHFSNSEAAAWQQGFETAQDRLEAHIQELGTLSKRAYNAIIEHHSSKIMHPNLAVCPYCNGSEGNELLNDLCKAFRK